MLDVAEIVGTESLVTVGVKEWVQSESQVGFGSLLGVVIVAMTESWAETVVDPLFLVLVAFFVEYLFSFEMVVGA